MKCHLENRVSASELLLQMLQERVKYDEEEQIKALECTKKLEERLTKLHSMLNGRYMEQLDSDRKIRLLRDRVETLERYTNIPKTQEAKPEQTLKPCPFCPDGTSLGVSPDTDTGYFRVYCITCSCKGPPRRTQKESKEAWQERRPRL